MFPSVREDHVCRPALSDLDVELRRFRVHLIESVAGLSGNLLALFDLFSILYHAITVQRMDHVQYRNRIPVVVFERVLQSLPGGVRTVDRNEDLSP